MMNKKFTSFFDYSSKTIAVDLEKQLQKKNSPQNCANASVHVLTKNKINVHKWESLFNLVVFISCSLLFLKVRLIVF